MAEDLFSHPGLREEFSVTVLKVSGRSIVWGLWLAVKMMPPSAFSAGNCHFRLSGNVVANPMLNNVMSQFPTGVAATNFAIHVT